jgi:hypothetical protein
MVKNEHLFLPLNEDLSQYAALRFSLNKTLPFKLTFFCFNIHYLTLLASRRNKNLFFVYIEYC